MLYLVSTPIGNLEDITLRALRILKECDIIACEDTRITGKLLKLLGLPTKPLLTYQDHNADTVRPKIIHLLQEGKNVALVSDAGTPLISDPGFKLVRDVKKAGLAVTTCPGANAVLSALQLSALGTDAFYFGGFLPQKSGDRQAYLARIKDLNATLVFYETAKRLKNVLNDMLLVLGDRSMTLIREITKKFEETSAGTISQIAQQATTEAFKGEIVLVIDKGTEKKWNEAEVKKMLQTQLKTLSLKSASEKVALLTGFSKKQVYTWALTFKK